MEELYNDIFSRWTRAFDDIALITRYKDQVVRTMYASSFRYNLKDYDKLQFPSDGSLQDQPGDIKDPYRYGMDGQEQPVYVAFQHSWNKICWEGFYHYSDQRVEYVEFEMGSGFPSVVDVMQFDGDRKISYQHFGVEGRGTFLYGKTREEAIARLKDKPKTGLICTIEKYVYEEGRITEAQGMSVSPGFGQFGYTDKYSYGSDGILDEIRTWFDNGNQELSYVRVPEQINVNELSDNLSRLIADAVVEAQALLQNDIEHPLALLELNYRSVENYLPMLVPRSLAEMEEILADCEDDEVFENLFIPSYENLIAIDGTTIEGPLKQLVQLMDQNESWDAGSTMLHKAAFLLTRGKLNGKIAVSEDFVAYAVDWSLAPDFAAVLRDCGQSEEVIHRWKARGWI